MNAQLWQKFIDVASQYADLTDISTIDYKIENPVINWYELLVEIINSKTKYYFRDSFFKLNPDPDNGYSIRYNFQCELGKKINSGEKPIKAIGKMLKKYSILTDQTEIDHILKVINEEYMKLLIPPFQYFDITIEAGKWYSGEFGDDGACYWKHDYFNDTRIAMGESEYFYAIRLYNSDKRGIGRAWILVADSGCYLYNGYLKGSHDSSHTNTFKSILDHLLGESGISVSGKHVSNCYINDFIYSYNGVDNFRSDHWKGLSDYFIEGAHDRFEEEWYDEDEDYTACEICGDEAERVLNGHDLCQSCYEEHTICEHCDSLISIDDSYGTDDGTYCESCYNNLFFYCEHCENDCSIDDLNKEIASRFSDHVCNDCAAEYLENKGLFHCEECDQLESIEDRHEIEIKHTRLSAYNSNHVIKETYIKFVCSDCISLYENDILESHSTTNQVTLITDNRINQFYQWISNKLIESMQYTLPIDSIFWDSSFSHCLKGI